MSGSSFGKLFRITTWGESHGAGIGVVIDGCPAGILLNEDMIQAFLDRRRPGQSKYTTKRSETDAVEILSGVFEGKTTGTPISLLVRNQDQRSRDYGNIAHTFRPGHADYGFFEKYGHLNLRTLPFANGCGFHDVVHENDDKADSIEMLLNRLGLTWEQTAAFGDGLNDEKMLSCAGMPVVMENGEDNLKLPGRVIAPACKDDGVAQVIETLLLK